MSTSCRIVLQPSRRLALLLLSAHGLAIFAAQSSLSAAPLVLVIFGVLISASWSVANAMLWLPDAVMHIEIHSGGNGHWFDRQGTAHAVDGIKASWCGEFLIIIGLGLAGSKYRWVILLPDSAEADTLRCLRVWCRWRPDQDAA